MKHICLVGDILIDVTLKSSENPLKMRLGGIIHAARALWAMGVPYTVAYFSPDYLDLEIEKFLSTLGSPKLIKLGRVNNSPYVILINEVKEIGDQGYEMLLRDNIQIEYFDTNLKELNSYEELFFISGNYEYNKVISHLSQTCNIHYDVANNVKNMSFFDHFKEKLATIFISTSSTIFKKNSVNSFNFDSFMAQFENITERVVLKENRGGSRAIDFVSKEKINIASQTQKIVHSVGVGDVYDSVYISYYKEYSFEQALTLSSYIASEYAVTTYPEDFKKMVERTIKIDVNELIHSGGCSLPWETRQECHIYLAAPDFDFVDTRPLDILYNSLLYHNFVPHRPIAENGQMEANADYSRKQKIFESDMILLDKCNMLIAVLLYNDPGTLIEIGLAAERKLPTLVYDPYQIANNCMLTQLPCLVTSNIDELLTEVFVIYSKNQAI